MRIGHFEQNIHGHGGIGSYIQRISGKQRLQGDQVFLYHRADTAVEDGTPIEHVKAYSDLAELARRDKLDILHVHTTTPYIGDMTAPMIRTIHTHQPYCPSGSRYFKNSDRACTRAFSISGCTLHALTEHCCSVRPAKLREAFQTTAWDQESLGHFAAIAISGYVREQMIRSGYATEGIHVLHNPAPDPVPITPIPAGVPRFVSIGRLEPLKGLQTLLRAFSLVRVPAHLDIAGDGTQFEQLRKLALTLGLADSVTFHGWLDPEGVNDLIDKSRAVVFPSTWPEPAGLVSLEAQTRGRPVIKTSRLQYSCRPAIRAR